MSKSGAKASKNNASNREKAREFLYSGKKVKPSKLILSNSSFMAAEYEDNTIVVNNAGDPIPWSLVVLACNN